MNCKNCQNTLKEEANFCDNCGAQVVLEQITFKKLLVEFFINIFGVDSRFFLTIRKMAFRPQDVINEFIGGVRRRYVNPFTFLAVGAGLSLIIFNYFADDFIAIQETMQADQLNEVKQKAALDLANAKGLSKEEIQKLELEKKIAQMQLDFNDGMWEFMLRYFNLLTFVFLLLYAVLSKWTFRKPHNFGEHVVINAYAYGFTTYLTLITFFVAILVHPSIYTISIVISIVYYMFVFGKLYQLSFGKSLLKLFRFLIGVVVVIIVFLIIAVIIGLIIGLLGLIKL